MLVGLLLGGGLVLTLCVGVGLGLWAVSNFRQTDKHTKTREYWEKWAQIRKTHDDVVNQLNERQIAADALACAREDDWIADQTHALSTTGVDTELAKVAADFIVLYRKRATLWREQAALTERSEQNELILSDFNGRKTRLDDEWRALMVKRGTVRARLITELGSQLSQ